MSASRCIMDSWRPMYVVYVIYISGLNESGDWITSVDLFVNLRTLQDTIYGFELPKCFWKQWDQKRIMTTEVHVDQDPADADQSQLKNRYI